MTSGLFISSLLYVYFSNFASFAVFVFVNLYFQRQKIATNCCTKLLCAAILHESHFKKNFTELEKKVNIAQAATPNMFLFEFCSAVAEF